MEKIKLSDLLNFHEYERIRPEKVKEVIKLKRRRRLRVGPLVSLIFENYETVWFQIQEMIRAEKLLREEDLRNVMEAYKDMIPDRNQLSATMFIEIPEEEKRNELLPKLVGIHERVYLIVGDRHRVKGVSGPESAVDYSTGRASTVHFLRWTLTEEQVEAFAREPVRVLVDHEHYRAEAEVPPQVKEELLRDLNKEEER